MNRNLQKAPIKQEVMQHMMDMVLNGDFAPGDRFHSEKELTQMFNISRPVLRESLSAMETIGIIDVRHGDGMYVTTLEPDVLLKPFSFLLRCNQVNVHVLFEARKILETGIIGLAANNIDEESMLRLKECIRRDEDCICDVEKFMENDNIFHMIIATASGNEILSLLMQAIGSLISQSRSITSQSEAVRIQASEHHKKIVQALEQRDATMAQAVMLEHLTYVYEQNIVKN